MLSLPLLRSLGPPALVFAPPNGFACTLILTSPKQLVAGKTAAVAAAKPAAAPPPSAVVRADGRFSPLRALTAGSRTNENMLLFRCLNRDMKRPHANADTLAPLLRDAVMPLRARWLRAAPGARAALRRGLEHPKWGAPGVVNFVGEGGEGGTRGRWVVVENAGARSLSRPQCVDLCSRPCCSAAHVLPLSRRPFLSSSCHATDARTKWLDAEVAAALTPPPPANGSGGAASGPQRRPLAQVVAVAAGFDTRAYRFGGWPLGGPVAAAALAAAAAAKGGARAPVRRAAFFEVDLPHASE